VAQNKLSVYNIALLAIGEATLTSLTEATEARRVLDEVYNRGDGAIKYCLEQGLWNFAMRAVAVSSSTSVTPDFGFQFAFDLPSDFVRLDMISGGESFGAPLTQYEFEGSYIYANVTTLYMRYVSDDASWGADLAKWPETFADCVGFYLASRIAPRLKNDVDTRELKAEMRAVFAHARSKDTSQEPTRFEPPGSWSTARRGGVSSRRDRGTRSSLLG